MSTRQIIATGAILGVTAALVVWFLERFESERVSERIAREAGQYLQHWDAFQEWLASQPGRGPELPGA